MKKRWAFVGLAALIFAAGYFAFLRPQTAAPSASLKPAEGSAPQKNKISSIAGTNAPLAPPTSMASANTTVRVTASVANNDAVPKKVSDYFLQRVPASLRDRSSVLLDEKSEWRILGKLAVDGIRVEDSDLNMEPTRDDDFALRSGQLPQLPDKFPSFPAADPDQAIMNLRNSYEKKSQHVQTIDFFDKSWIVHSDQSVTPCLNIEVQREGRTHEHEVVCVHAQTGEVVASRSVIKKF